jgi:nucleotide-binding universal stress UspA family protein
MSVVERKLPGWGRTERVAETRVIVVGYDGSAAATAAVRWAAAHASDRAGRLVLVHAHDEGTPAVVARAAAARARAEAERLRTHEDLPADLNVELRFTDQPPAAGLGRIAAELGADGIVVGRHHGGGFSSDTVRELLRHTDLPVTVVG